MCSALFSFAIVADFFCTVAAGGAAVSVPWTVSMAIPNHCTIHAAPVASWNIKCIALNVWMGEPFSVQNSAKRKAFSFLHTTLMLSLSLTHLQHRISLPFNCGVKIISSIVSIKFLRDTKNFLLEFSWKNLNNNNNSISTTRHINLINLQCN